MLYSTSWIAKQQLRGPWIYDGEIDLSFAGAFRTAATIVLADRPYSTPICIKGLPTGKYKLQNRSNSQIQLILTKRIIP